MLNIEDLIDKGELFDGHYMLLRPLSVDGATADVWLALDTHTVSEDDKDKLEDVPRLSDEEIERLGLVVAIKIYRPKNALDIEGEQRFRDEYMIVFNCHHTNLIHPTQYSIFEGVPYLVLPYCKLGSSELLIGQQLTDGMVWKYILDVASGLAYLHALKPPIVHQDIKPANILLDDTHHYAITDFGISSQKGGVHGYYSDDEHSGTFAYMAPERFQIDADPIPQSDIWAFGATVYEILTGKVPFGEDGGKTQAETNAPVPEMKGVSSDLQRLVTACLAKEPGDRPSAEQIVVAARARQFPVKSRKLLYVALAAMAVIVMGLAVLLVPREDRDEKPEPPKAEDVYKVALGRMDCNNLDSLELGMRQMDSLGKANYVPAIYQMAFTYGWYGDSASVRRKKLLGIKTYGEIRKKKKKKWDGDDYLPVADKYSHRAVELFSKILEINDSSYSDINANAAYRLACYYVEDNNIYKKDTDKGKHFLLLARKWVLMAGDKTLVGKIDRGLDSYRQNKR